MAINVDIVIAQGRKDRLGGMLINITGWFLGSRNAAEHSREIIDAIDRGFVGFRVHFAKLFPNGAEAYEVTDKGLAYIRDHCGAEAAQWASDYRAWYRENAAKPTSAP